MRGMRGEPLVAHDQSVVRINHKTYGILFSTSKKKYTKNIWSNFILMFILAYQLSHIKAFFFCNS